MCTFFTLVQRCNTETFQYSRPALAYYVVYLTLCRKNPITWEGQEMLLLPVALEDERDVYGGLYSGDSEDDQDSGSVL
jgi:hypothetical protein